MKTIKKNVYYCDHCKKRGLSAGHIRNHESSCTANPIRHCKLCGRKDISPIVQEFKKRFELEPFMVEDDLGNYMGDSCNVIWKGEPVTLDEVRKAVDNCPNCLFAVIRQCKFNFHYFKEAFKFDYKKELDSALWERNQKEVVYW